MPKTAKHLWPSVVSWENLLQAAKEASRHKRYHKEVMRFNARLEENIFLIQQQLQAGTWRPGEYRHFEVFEPKRREVAAPCFADRVVHHAVTQIAGPYFERRFISQSFACRVGKGTHAASEYLTSMLRHSSRQWPKVYVLKADVSKYFYSIDHEILLRVIGRTIGDKRMLGFFRVLINRSVEGPRGLPLGALTSQLLANAYLDQLDHYIKDTLGVRHYVRYMDDFILLSSDKTELWRLLAEIRDFLAYELHLTLNRKTNIFPVAHGVDFAGYRHWPEYRLPRKRNVRRAAQRFAGLSRCYARGDVELETVRACVASFVGYMKHCKGWRSGESTLARLVLRRSHFESEE